MTDSVREVPETFADVKSPHKFRIFPSWQLTLLVLIWLMLAALAGFVLWRDAMDPHGMIVEGLRFRISYLSRLGPLAVLVLYSLVFAMVMQVNGLRQRVAGLPALLAAYWREATWFLVGAGLVGALVIVWVLRAFPNSGDEYDYLFQAKTFLAGRLWNPMPPLPDFLRAFHLMLENGKWAATYPPGWPVLLAAVSALGLPFWLTCPLGGALLLFALFKLGQIRDGALGGVLAVALVAASPFFLFNAGSYFNHITAAAAGLLFCWAAVDFLNRPRLLTALLAGIALGAVGLIRPIDALLFALPFTIEFCWKARRMHYRRVPAVIIGGLPFLVVLLLYNHTLTGSILGFSGDHTPVRFGFHPVDEDGTILTPRDQLRHAAFRFLLLAEWTSPLLVLGYGPAFVWLAVRRRLNFLDFLFPTYVLAFLLVPFTGVSQYGPRYYFEAWPFFVLTVVSGVRPLLHLNGLRWRAFTSSLLLAHFAIALAAGVIFSLFMRKIIDERMDLYDQVAAAGLSNAVVIVRSGTGSLRLLEPPDLLRNGIALDGNVIYARDLADRLRELQQRFPQRQFYVYQRAHDNPKGSLRQLR